MARPAPYAGRCPGAARRGSSWLPAAPAALREILAWVVLSCRDMDEQSAREQHRLAWGIDALALAGKDGDGAASLGCPAGIGADQARRAGDADDAGLVACQAAQADEEAGEFVEMGDDGQAGGQAQRGQRAPEAREIDHAVSEGHCPGGTAGDDAASGKDARD